MFVSDDHATKYDPDDPRLNTIRFEEVLTTIHDLRTLPDMSLAECGFDTLSYRFGSITIENATTESVGQYKRQTEAVLTDFFKAEKVISYDCRVSHIQNMTTMEN